MQKSKYKVWNHIWQWEDRLPGNHFTYGLFDRFEGEPGGDCFKLPGRVPREDRASPWPPTPPHPPPPSFALQFSRLAQAQRTPMLSPPRSLRNPCWPHKMSLILALIPTCVVGEMHEPSGPPGPLIGSAWGFISDTDTPSIGWALTHTRRRRHTHGFVISHKYSAHACL